MARLILTLDGQVLAEYNMNKERYTVGRLPDNDIRIDNPAAEANPATAHLFIVNPLAGGSLLALFSTHPPMEERIARLESMATGGN